MAKKGPVVESPPKKCGKLTITNEPPSVTRPFPKTITLGGLGENPGREPMSSRFRYARGFPPLGEGNSHWNC